MRGGKRKGSGRKKGEPTKTIRVPECLVDEIKAIIENHKKKKSKEEKRNSFQYPILSKEQLIIFQSVMVECGHTKSKAEARKLTNTAKKCKNEFLKIVHCLNDDDFKKLSDIPDLYVIDE